MRDFINKRNLFRIILPLEMCGKLVIYKFNNNVINMGQSHISILNINAFGVQFKSKLNLPIENTIYNIIFKLYDNDYKIECELKWKKEKKNGYFFYGGSFCLKENEKEKLMKIMTKLSVQTRKTNEGIYKYCTKSCLKLRG